MQRIWALVIALLAIILPRPASADTLDKLARGERILNTVGPDGTERFDGFLGRHGLTNADYSALAGHPLNKGKIILACSRTEFSGTQLEDIRGTLEATDAVTVRLKGGVCRGATPVAMPGIDLALPESRGSLAERIRVLESDLALAQTNLKVAETEVAAQKSAVTVAQADKQLCNEARTSENAAARATEQTRTGAFGMIVLALALGLVVTGSRAARNGTRATKAEQALQSSIDFEEGQKKAIEDMTTKAIGGLKLLGEREATIGQRDDAVAKREQEAAELEDRLRSVEQGLDTSRQALASDRGTFTRERDDFNATKDRAAMEAMAEARALGYGEGKTRIEDEMANERRLVGAEAEDTLRRAGESADSTVANAVREAREILEQTRREAETQRDAILAEAAGKVTEAEALMAAATDERERIERARTDLAEEEGAHSGRIYAQRQSLADAQESFEAKRTELLAWEQRLAELSQKAEAIVADAMPEALERARHQVQSELSAQYAQLAEEQQLVEETLAAAKVQLQGALSGRMIPEVEPLPETPMPPDTPPETGASTDEVVPPPEELPKRTTVFFPDRIPNAAGTPGPDVSVSVSGELPPYRDEMPTIPRPSRPPVELTLAEGEHERAAADDSGYDDTTKVRGGNGHDSARYDDGGPDDGLDSDRPTSVATPFRIEPERRKPTRKFRSPRGDKNATCTECGARILWANADEHCCYVCPVCPDAQPMTHDEYAQHDATAHLARVESANVT